MYEHCNSPVAVDNKYYISPQLCVMCLYVCVCVVCECVCVCVCLCVWGVSHSSPPITINTFILTY